MTSQEHELQTEREYVAGLYDRLDDERARAAERHAAALRGTGTTLVDREVEVRTAAREVTRLNVADNGLCFGRLDGIDGERRYVGRIGIYDAANEFEPLLLDWRAPAARPFYVATAANPEGMRRRRQFHTRGRTIVDFTDELLGRPGDTRASEATGDVTGASEATGDVTARDEFVSNLTRVRYVDGQVDFAHRKHFFTDWAATGTAADVTASLTPAAVTVMKRLNADGRYLAGIPEVDRAVTYIPSAAVDAGVLGALQTGDYLAAYSDAPDLDVTHTGIVVQTPTGPVFRNASSLAADDRVVDTPLADYVRSVPGIVVLRS